MPCELYITTDRKATFLMIRSGPCTGKMRQFGQELAKFIQESGFTNVIILSSTTSPVSRERESNRQIPEVFAYVNNYIIKTNPKYYSCFGIRKFGYWLDESGIKKTKPH